MRGAGLLGSGLTGQPSLDAMRRRRGLEIMQTSDANISGAVVMSSLFSGAATMGFGGDGGVGGGGLVGGFSQQVNTLLQGGRQTSLGAPVTSIVNRCGFCSFWAASLSGVGRQETCSCHTEGASLPQPLTHPLNPKPQPQPQPPSAYIDGTMTAAITTAAGQPLAATASALHPLAMHAFDQVASGAVTTFDDVTAASLDNNAVTVAVFVDEGCPSVMEVCVRAGGGWRGYGRGLEEI